MGYQSLSDIYFQCEVHGYITVVYCQDQLTASEACSHHKGVFTNTVFFNAYIHTCINILFILHTPLSRF